MYDGKECCEKHGCLHEAGVPCDPNKSCKWCESLSKIRPDTHISHCCVIHGCKYGDNDDCCVVMSLEKQKFPCESCSEEEHNKSAEYKKLEELVEAANIVQTYEEDSLLYLEFVHELIRELASLNVKNVKYGEPHASY